MNNRRRDTAEAPLNLKPRNAITNRVDGQTQVKSIKNVAATKPSASPAKEPRNLSVCGS